MFRNIGKDLDLDRDGHQDFAASAKDGSVTIYFSKGDGTFDPPLYLHAWKGLPLDQRGIVITSMQTNTCISVYTNSWVDNGTNRANWAWVCLPGPTNVSTNILALSAGPWAASAPTPGAPNVAGHGGF